jgi:uncharacterized protein DUF7009
VKIRIYDNSIRLRLDRAEVDRINQLQPVNCTTHFPTGAIFQYRLSVGGAEVDARYAQSCVEIVVPEAQVSRWAGNEAEVSIRAQVNTTNGPLTLLVEKDFECLDPRDGEDQGNRFKNPKATA